MKPDYTSHDGRIKLYNADCMDYLATLKENEFDLAVVDPPYGIDVTKMNMGGRQTVIPDKNKNWDNCVPDVAYFNSLFAASGNQIVWGGNYFELEPSQYFCIWDKGETMYGRDFAECEFAWVRKGGTRLFKMSPNQLQRIHPTQKPVKLYDWIYKNYAEEGQNILDTHLGSGSNAIAAHYAGMTFTGCELDPEYFDAACTRIEAETKQISLI